MASVAPITTTQFYAKGTSESSLVNTSHVKNLKRSGDINRIISYFKTLNIDSASVDESKAGPKIISLMSTVLENDDNHTPELKELMCKICMSLTKTYFLDSFKRNLKVICAGEALVYFNSFLLKLLCPTLYAALTCNQTEEISSCNEEEKKSSKLYSKKIEATLDEDPAILEELHIYLSCNTGYKLPTDIDKVIDLASFAFKYKDKDGSVLDKLFCLCIDKLKKCQLSSENIIESFKAKLKNSHLHNTINAEEIIDCWFASYLIEKKVSLFFLSAQRKLYLDPSEFYLLDEAIKVKNAGEKLSPAQEWLLAKANGVILRKHNPQEWELILDRIKDYPEVFKNLLLDISLNYDIDKFENLKNAESISLINQEKSVDENAFLSYFNKQNEGFTITNKLVDFLSKQFPNALIHLYSPDKSNPIKINSDFYNLICRGVIFLGGFYITSSVSEVYFDLNTNKFIGISQPHTVNRSIGGNRYIHFLNSNGIFSNI